MVAAGLCPAKINLCCSGIIYATTTDLCNNPKINGLFLYSYPLV